MKRVASVRGVEVREQKDGTRIVFIRFQNDGKRYLERIGKSKRVKGRDVTMAKARRVLDKRRREIAEAKEHGEVWRSEKEQQQYEQQQAAEQQDERRHLLFEVASEAFLEAVADDYADPLEVRNVFRNRLALVFKGKHLDEITRADVRQYFTDRAECRGPFVGRRKVGLRTPQAEVTALSALYSWLIEDQELDLANPCHRPRGRRKRSRKALRYQPAHEAAIPSREALTALFAAVPIEDEPHGRAHPGVVMRALFKTTYYTAGRPESEPCQLRHGDVVFADPGKVQALDGRPVLGRITFRDTKTGGDRTIPLHPELVEDLEAVMLPRPTDPAALERWARTPIFRKRAGKKATPSPASAPMDRASYRVAWLATIEAAAKNHPELAGLWLRDLRRTARTYMTDAGTPEPTVRRIMGHATDVSQGYYGLRDESAESAILALGLEEGDQAANVRLATEPQPHRFAAVPPIA